MRFGHSTQSGTSNAALWPNIIQHARNALAEGNGRLAAVLDGSIFGDHCSPISDTTILSASASSCDLMAHVRTQMPYSILAAMAALVCGYLPAAFGFNWVLSLALGLGTITAFFFFGSKAETSLEERNA